MRYFIFFKQKNSTTTYLFLYEDAPNLKENEIDRQVVAIVDAWKHADFLCKNYILNGLDNTLYNASTTTTTCLSISFSLRLGASSYKNLVKFNVVR